jgi:hypothetical protein
MKFHLGKPEPYIFQTSVFSPASDLTTPIPARTIFDTGSDVELVNTSFIERNGLAELLTQLKVPKTMMGLAGACIVSEGKIRLTWKFEHTSTPRDIICYLVEVHEKEFDILLGRSFLHEHGLLVVQDPKHGSEKAGHPVAKVRVIFETDPQTQGEAKTELHLARSVAMTEKERQRAERMYRLQQQENLLHGKPPSYVDVPNDPGTVSNQVQVEKLEIESIAKDDEKETYSRHSLLGLTSPLAAKARSMIEGIEAHKQSRSLRSTNSAIDMTSLVEKPVSASPLLMPGTTLNHGVQQAPRLFNSQFPVRTSFQGSSRPGPAEPEIDIKVQSEEEVIVSGLEQQAFAQDLPQQSAGQSFEQEKHQQRRVVQNVTEEAAIQRNYSTPREVVQTLAEHTNGLGISHDQGEKLSLGRNTISAKKDSAGVSGSAPLLPGSKDDSVLGKNESKPRPQVANRAHTSVADPKPPKGARGKSLFSRIKSFHIGKKSLPHEVQDATVSPEARRFSQPTLQSNLPLTTEAAHESPSNRWSQPITSLAEPLTSQAKLDLNAKKEEQLAQTSIETALNLRSINETRTAPLTQSAQNTQISPKDKDTEVPQPADEISPVNGTVGDQNKIPHLAQSPQSPSSFGGTTIAGSPTGSPDPSAKHSEGKERYRLVTEEKFPPGRASQDSKNLSITKETENIASLEVQLFAGGEPSPRDIIRKRMMKVVLKLRGIGVSNQMVV